MKDRRQFLKGLLGISALAAYPTFRPSPARAWVVTAAIAVASFATSMIMRGKQAKAAALISQANFQLLSSISREIGVINTSMQLALYEIGEIRNQLEKTPDRTVALDSHTSMIALWQNYRKKLSSFMDEDNQNLDAATYFEDLKAIMNQYQFYRDKLITVTPTASYEYAMHVAISQEFETMMALELVSDEALEQQVGYDLTELKTALEFGYLPFLRAAIDEDVPESLVSLHQKLKKKIDSTIAEQKKNPVQRFFDDGGNGAIVCQKTQDISFHNDFTCSPTLDIADDDGCDAITVIEYTLTPLTLSKSSEVVSNDLTLFLGTKSTGDPYTYGHNVENIVLNKHKMGDRICGGNIDNAFYRDVDTRHFPSWSSTQDQLNADIVNLESLRSAIDVCRLAIASVECRLKLLATGENACGV